jgi:hypothetical protein
VVLLRLPASVVEFLYIEKVWMRWYAVRVPPHMNYYGLITSIFSSDGVSKSWPGIMVLKYLQRIWGKT